MKLIEKHPNFADVAKNNSLTKEVNKTEIEILGDIYVPFSEEIKLKSSINSMKLKKLKMLLKLE